MILSEFLQLLKLRDAKNRAQSAGTTELALFNEINARLSLAGGTPGALDYTGGTSLGTNLTGNTTSSTFTLPRDFVDKYVLIRLTTTVTTTPTATFAIQGSVDNTNWFSIDVSDSATPGTFNQATFVVTTATTLTKIIRPAQKVKFIRINITANTNVTVTTADATLL